MPSDIQTNIRNKKARETATKPAVTYVTSPVPAKEKAYTDDELVTVLHGFGKVLPMARHLVDDYEFTGGVCRNVPYSIAKHWKNGTRPDGKKPHGRVFITILPNDADEDDFARAAGLTREEQRKMAAILSAGDALNLVEDLGPDKARKLRDALSRYLQDN